MSPISPRLKQYITIAIVTVFVVITGLVLFIELDTGGAANLTDQVLRPLLGDNRVIALEKVFFNISDVVNQLRYVINKPTNPFLSTDSSAISDTTNAPHSNLNLSPIHTTAFLSLPNEGTWRQIDLNLFPDDVVMADTFIRPDASRPYAFVTLAQMDMNKLQLWSVAGTEEPGAIVGKPGPGVIPSDIYGQGLLVAAFDGGFQYRDGQYGMIVGDTTYLPLKRDIATIVGYTDGTIKIIKYEGQSLGDNVAFVRQNCPMLIENGNIGTQDDTNKKLWGRTPTFDIYTWRSGIGVTAEGNLVFAAGNSLIPSTLAAALKSAGAVNAMQLDINPYWVRFNVFNNFASGHYTSTTIMKGLQDGSYSYTHGYKKDFFYVTKK